MECNKNPFVGEQLALSSNLSHLASGERVPVSPMTAPKQSLESMQEEVALAS